MSKKTGLGAIFLGVLMTGLGLFWIIDMLRTPRIATTGTVDWAVPVRVSDYSYHGGQCVQVRFQESDGQERTLITDADGLHQGDHVKVTYTPNHASIKPVWDNVLHALTLPVLGFFVLTFGIFSLSDA